MKIKKIKLIQGSIILIAPFLLLFLIMLIWWGGYKYYNILNHYKKYETGIFIVDSIDCDSGSYANDNNTCVAYGHVNSIKTKLNLGVKDDQDLLKKEYYVFYRQDGKWTLVRELNEKVFNIKPYLYKAFFFIVIPFVMLILTIIYYINLNKKLNKIDDK